MDTPKAQDPLAGYHLMEEPGRTRKTILLTIAALLVVGLLATVFLYCGSLKGEAFQDSYCSASRWQALFTRIAPVSPPGGACGGWLPNRCADGYVCDGATPKAHGICRRPLLD